MSEEKKQGPTWQEKFDADTSEFQSLEVPEMPTTGPAAKDGDEEKKGEEPVQTSEAGKESDKKDSAEDPGEPAKKAKVPRSVQKRIDREVKKRKELEEKLKSLESNAKQGENEPEKKEQNDSGPVAILHEYDYIQTPTSGNPCLGRALSHKSKAHPKISHTTGQEADFTLSVYHYLTHNQQVKQHRRLKTLVKTT